MTNPELPPDSSTESPVWSGSPSQWLNIVPFVFCVVVGACFIAGAILWDIPLVAAGAVIPLGIAFWNWLTVRSTKLEVTTERISTRTGIFSRRREDLELYRVKDTTLHEPFLLRLVSRANIRLRTSDRTTPLMVLPALKDAEALRQKIRVNVERLRIKRGVREMDMDVES